MQNQNKNLSLAVVSGFVGLALVLGCSADDSGLPNNQSSSGGSTASGGSSNSGGSGNNPNFGGTSSGGTSSGGTSSGGAPGSGGEGGGDACETCVNSACSTQWAACDADAACLALLDCLELCTDDACGDACYTNNSAGAPLLDAVDVCAEQQCATQCGGSTGTDPCETCINASCSAQMNACDSDPACAALLACFDQCADEACDNQCFTTHQAGAAKLDAFDMCIEQSCATQCV